MRLLRITITPCLLLLGGCLYPAHHRVHHRRNPHATVHVHGHGCGHVYVEGTWGDQGHHGKHGPAKVYGHKYGKAQGHRYSAPDHHEYDDHAEPQPTGRVLDLAVDRLATQETQVQGRKHDTPPGHAQAAPPGHVKGTPPGHAKSAPSGHVKDAPHGHSEKSAPEGKDDSPHDSGGKAKHGHGEGPAPGKVLEKAAGESKGKGKAQGKDS